MIDDLVLHKYASRRLFDATRRRVVKLDEIADLVKAGANISARDFAGREITGEILAQIVCREEAKHQHGPLTPSAMRNIIRLLESDLKLLLPLHLDHLAKLLKWVAARPPETIAAEQQPVAIATFDEEAEAQVERSYARRLMGGI